MTWGDTNFQLLISFQKDRPASFILVIRNVCMALLDLLKIAQIEELKMVLLVMLGAS